MLLHEPTRNVHIYKSKDSWYSRYNYFKWLSHFLLGIFVVTVFGLTETLPVPTFIIHGFLAV
jgi:hypothetical protein